MWHESDKNIHLLYRERMLASHNGMHCELMPFRNLRRPVAGLNPSGSKNNQTIVTGNRFSSYFLSKTLRSAFLA
jgi:hypothetical protein